MITREWPLLIFTILGQMAAGALLVLMVVRSYATAKAGYKEADRLTDGPSFMVFPLMGLALLASLFHMNNLGNIIRAVPNLGSSWLSREVVVSVVFVAFAGLYALLQWRKIGPNILRSIFGWIAAAIGIFQTYAMASVYMIRTQLAWNTPSTMVTFFVTYLLLGVMAVAVAMLVNYNTIQKKDAEAAEKQLDLLRGALKGIASSAIILLGIEFLVLPFYMAYLGVTIPKSLQLLTGTYGITLGVRLLFVFAGAGLLATFMYRNASSGGNEKVIAILAYSAFILVLAAEVIGRFLFYVTSVRTGL